MSVWVEHWTGSTRMIPRNWAAGIATQARKTFHVSARHVHGDPTSFSVRGMYEASEQQESEASVIAITRRAPRAIIGKISAQWMLALATTQEGDVPLFLRP